MRLSLKSYAARHAFSVGLAIFTAVIINFYYSFSKEGWIILTTFLACQTTRGTAFKQSVIYVFIVLLIVMLLPTNNDYLMRDRVIDGLIGGGVGILFGQFVFPVKFYSEFALGVVPILIALKAYSSTFSRFLLHANMKNFLTEKKWQIEIALAARQSLYPEWVYEVGFNPGLRAGFRFFLVNLERVTEIFFSMNYLADSGIEPEWLSDLSQYINEVAQKNEELLQVLIDYFNEDKFNSVQSGADYTTDMAELEKALNQLVPANLDLLDVSSGYVNLTALVRDLKDLRGLLLQLVMALPGKA